MSLEASSHPIRDQIRLAWAFAEILTRDEKRAEALFYAALLDAKARLDASEPSASGHRLLAAIREGYYRGEAGPRRAGGHVGAEEVCGRASSGPLGRAVDVLPSEDRELLFLRYGAGLDLPEIATISGRTPEAARARIVELCAALPVGSDRPGGRPARGTVMRIAPIGDLLPSSTIH
jgi:DNA-directed RNA polymerase specialized sigma24 family protein